MARKTRKPSSVRSNTEIVTLAVLLAGGRICTVDTEDVAIQAHKLAPNRFSWKKYKAQVHLDAVLIAGIQKAFFDVNGLEYLRPINNHLDTTGF